MTKIAKIDTQTKLALAKREAEDAVFAELDNQQEIEIDEKFKIEAAMAVGMMAAVPAVLKSIAAHLGSKHILALREFQERKLYKGLGHDNFADFLTNSPHSPMTKNQYFDRLNLLLKEGEETYDLLNEIGISNRDRKRLPPDSVRVVGDEILVNDYAVQIGSSSEVKAVLNDLIRNWGSAEKESKRLADEREQSEKRIESLQDQLKTGAAQYDELDRARQAEREGTAYERALMKAVGALLAFAIEAKDTVLIERAHRAEDDMKTIWSQVQNVRAALHLDNFVFTEDNADTRGISPLARQAIEDSGDWGDEMEQ